MPRELTLLEAVNLKRVGYWRGHDGQYPELPDPRDYVDLCWDRAARALVSDWVESAPLTRSWRGMSRCRFCAEYTGSRCFSDGVYIWPEGFHHYIEKHNVKPPQDFIDHVLSKTTLPVRDAPDTEAQQHAKKYPEHQKLKVVAKESQSIGAFLDWLFTSREPHIELYQKVETDFGHEMMPAYARIEDLLAAYFDIDQGKIEEEKQGMIAELQAAAQQRKGG